MPSSTTFFQTIKNKITFDSSVGFRLYKIFEPESVTYLLKFNHNTPIRPCGRSRRP